MTASVMRRVLLILSVILITVSGWNLHIPKLKRQCIGGLLGATLVFGAASPSHADDKLRNLPDAKFLSIIASDITDKQALATADFTRSIYSEECTFTDEIDTYEIDEYVKGTKALFDSKKSIVELASTPVLTDNIAEYRFKETLAFKVPLNPKVDLTGKVQLTRGSDGLVVKSREIWDQGVKEVLQHVYF